MSKSIFERIAEKIKAEMKEKRSFNTIYLNEKTWNRFIEEDLFNTKVFGAFVKLKSIDEDIKIVNEEISITIYFVDGNEETIRTNKRFYEIEGMITKNNFSIGSTIYSCYSIKKVCESNE